MNIQILQLNPNEELRDDQITVSTLSQPRSLDEYEVNIIDLSDPEMWSNKRNTIKRIDSFDDFSSIHTMVLNRKRTNIIYVCPQNVKLSLDFNKSLNKYNHCKRIKDDLSLFANLIKAVFPNGFFNIEYEPTTTTIEGIQFNADFYFPNSLFVVRHITDKSEKNVTFFIDSIRETKNSIVTSLNITASLQHLQTFLKSVFPEKTEAEEPSWIKDYCFFNDNELLDNIVKIEKKIEDLKSEKEGYEKSVIFNKKVKSILYSTGGKLEKIVSEIFEQLLDCDLSNFLDDKKEDLRIIKDDIVFIGEIKGISTNVKNSHISQVDNHFDNYFESANEDDKKKAGKQLLIINPFRDKPLNEREPISDEQIRKAERNECLIIETKVLLRVYERFLRKEITTDDCLELFKNKSGLLSLDLVNSI